MSSLTAGRNEPSVSEVRSQYHPNKDEIAIMKTVTKFACAASLALLAGGCAGRAGPAGSQSQRPVPAAARVDTVYLVDTVTAAPMAAGAELQAGRFDNGKMWTFEYPPLDYFGETYGFAPDSVWFRRARLGALRLPNCTASFVSPIGLVLTNHHCARESVSQVSAPGERLLDNGFYAPTLEDERPVADLYVDQLIAIREVTAELDAAPDAERDQVAERIGERIAEEYGSEDSVVVEIVSLWNGATASAYVFRRFTDVRLVMAPELKLANFGGDYDNFTYPRYSLDMSFLRVYGPDGRPYVPEFYFPWSAEAVAEGDAVFMIGNPGSTSRLQTMAELDFRRQVGDKVLTDFLASRADAFQAYADLYPDEAETLDIRNKILELRNFEKAYGGMWSGLHDPVILARRRDNEDRFRAAIGADSALAARYGGQIDRMAQIQEQKLAYAAEHGAFFLLGHPDYSPAIENRGVLAYQYLSAQAGGAPQDVLSELKEGLRSVAHQPLELQRRLLAARLADFARYLGGTDRTVTQILRGRSPDQAAEWMLSQSVLGDSARAVAALEAGILSAEDPAVQLVVAIVPRIGPFQTTMSRLEEQEETVARQIGRARFEVYGTVDPPDATFSLRIADGFVSGYEYNGTIAPIHTTFYGLYDHLYSYGAGSDWDLPERWVAPPPDFDLSKPLNFVSTADIIGGNSGSPVISPDLELVGVAFDGNIESLPGDYIYLPDRNRAVAVDAAGMLEALEHLYRAARLVEELRAGARGR